MKNLLKFPVEIISLIYYELDSLSDGLRLARTCRPLHKVWATDVRRIS